MLILSNIEILLLIPEYSLPHSLSISKLLFFITLTLIVLIELPYNIRFMFLFLMFIFWTLANITHSLLSQSVNPDISI